MLSRYSEMLSRYGEIIYIYTTPFQGHRTFACSHRDIEVAVTAISKRAINERALNDYMERLHSMMKHCNVIEVYNNDQM